MNADPALVARLPDELPDLDWIVDPSRVARLSQDFSWFSPVFKRQLGGKLAELAVRPRTEDEVRRLVAACARDRIPMTLRGSGTGNYGQSIPLHGGVLLDLSGLNGFGWVRGGVGRAQAGMRLHDFDKQARPHGWELRAVPSTFRTRDARRPLRRRLRRLRLDHLRAGRGARQRARREGDDGRARTARRRAARRRGDGAAPHLRHDRHRARARGGARRRRIAVARIDRDLRDFDAGLDFADALAQCARASSRRRSASCRRAVTRYMAGARRLPARRPRRRASSPSPSRPRARCSASSPRHGGTHQLPQDRGRGAGERPDDARVHLEPHDAARAQDRQDADLHPERVRPDPQARPGRARSNARSATRC